MVKTLKDIDIDNKKVIIRCDFNVPINNGKILDDTRIVESLETINYCLEHNCKIILMSHMGRVKKKEDLKNNSLYPVSVRLKKLLHKKVIFLDKNKAPIVTKTIKNMKNKDIVLLENTRYQDLRGNKESSNNISLVKYFIYILKYVDILNYVFYFFDFL